MPKKGEADDPPAGKQLCDPQETVRVARAAYPT